MQKLLQYNISGVTGRFGSGKSLYAVELAIFYAERTRKPIVFNFAVNIRALRDYARAMGFSWVANHAEIHVVELFGDINRVWSYRNSVAVVDELGIFANARAWGSLPKEFLRNLVQVRKLDIHLILIFQYIDQVDKQIRQNIQHWIMCRSSSVYSIELRAPRMLSRIAYHYDSEKFYRLMEDTRARGNIILPWLWSMKVYVRVFKLFEFLAVIRNLRHELYDLLLFTLSTGTRRHRFRRIQIKEKLLFEIFDSTALVGEMNQQLNQTQLNPSAPI